MFLASVSDVFLISMTVEKSSIFFVYQNVNWKLGLTLYRMRCWE